jgi:hypothetical protein
MARKRIAMFPLPNDRFHRSVKGATGFLLTQAYHEIEPVFHRDGVFFDRNAQRAWVGLDGKAYERVIEKPEDFFYVRQWNLDHNSEPLLSEAEFQALETLVGSPVLGLHLRLKLMGPHTRECNRRGKRNSKQWARKAHAQFIRQRKEQET